ncbi:hypothetical protein [Candidatus Tisiphia endosymbiont of Nemotelus uliginosus]|uniref:F0F1 ATP synthase subunit B family protein n=1 Tax=Candidatus Tisiphia endosymbiont of Nemotelus uliginosus TaxID=3077926 RepID=UPI0035C8A111
MPQFDITFFYSQIFWLAIIFSGLYFLVHKFITPLAQKILDNRQSVINSNIAQAESITAKAKELQQQYNNEIQQIQHLVENIRQEELIKMQASFLTRKYQLTNELKAQIMQNNSESTEHYKLFWEQQEQNCINLARLVITRVTNQPVNLELLTRLYKKIL